MNASPSLSRRIRWIASALLAVALLLAGISVAPAAAHAAATTAVAGTITGRVTAADTGAALSGVSVYINSYGAGGSGSTSVGSDGSYSLDISKFPAARYHIDVYPDSSDYASVDYAIPGTISSKSTLVKNFALQRTGTVSGRITGTNDPAGSSAFSAELDSTDGGFEYSSNPADSNGNYEFTGIPAGTYKIRFSGDGSYASNYYPGTYVSSKATTITLNSGQDLTGINGTLQVGATFRGKVTAADTKAALSGVEVALSSSINDGRSTSTASDGSYSIEGVAPGTYIADYDTRYSLHSEYVAQYLGSRFESQATKIPVSGTGTVTQNIALTHGGSIAGTITGLAGKSYGATAYAYDSGSKTWLDVGDAYSGSETASATYSVPGLSAGTYKVGFRDYSTTATLSPQFYSGKTSLDTATTVTVTGAKATTGVNARLTYTFKAAATPTVSGNGAVGATLTAAAGTWSPAPTTLTYQWKRNGVSIAKATAKTYKVVAADAGTRITVFVTGSRSGYASVTRSSAATAIARLLTAAPTPTVSGTVKVRATLTAHAGSWTPAPVTLTYQWKRAGAAIPKATGSSYTLTASDKGKAITVTVTGKKTGYTSIARTSKAVTPKS